MGIQIQPQLRDGEVDRLQVIQLVRRARLYALRAAVRQIKPREQRSLHDGTAGRIALGIPVLERDIGIGQRGAGRQCAARILTAFGGLRRQIQIRQNMDSSP